jgi:tRNA G46 methylase TrmB
MKENSEIYIATDSAIYVRFILNSIYNCKDYFLWVNQSKINLSIKDYFNIETKYYKKAINSQRKPCLFILRKL